MPPRRIVMFRGSRRCAFARPSLLSARQAIDDGFGALKIISQSRKLGNGQKFRNVIITRRFIHHLSLFVFVLNTQGKTIRCGSGTNFGLHFIYLHNYNIFH